MPLPKIDPKVTWACQRCTLVNPVRLRKCSACGTAVNKRVRDKLIQRAETGPTSAQPVKSGAKTKSGALAKPRAQKPVIPVERITHTEHVDTVVERTLGFVADDMCAWDIERTAAIVCATGDPTASKGQPRPAPAPVDRTATAATEQEQKAILRGQVDGLDEDWRPRATQRRRGPSAADRLRDDPMTSREAKALQRALANSRTLQRMPGPREGVGEAPRFYPTEEEFANPLAYLRQLRPAAEHYGICCVVPPAVRREREKATHGDAEARRTASAAARAYAGDLDAAREAVEDAAASLPADMRFSPRKMPLHRLQEGRPFEQSESITVEAYLAQALAFERDHAGWTEDPRGGASREATFWRTVSSSEPPCCVLYGADLDSAAHAPRAFEGGASWDLTALPSGAGSTLLPDVCARISGVTTPWLYVGMQFGCFAWHVEDLWLYSVNVLRRGAPKTWYGVPAHAADAFERTARKLVPALFDRSPDLLYQLVTMVAPAELAAQGVPVYTCAQHEGDLVLTFPRAYHSGLSHGFNVAEAVNLAPADWLPRGFEAMAAARRVARAPVFSLERLAWELAKRCVAAEPGAEFALRTARELAEPFSRMVNREIALRQAGRAAGITARLDSTHTDAERVAHGLRVGHAVPDALEAGEICLPCIACAHLCYFGLVRCRTCPQQGIACLEHEHTVLCRCAPSHKVVETRHSAYSLKWMVAQLKGLEARALATFL